MMNDTGAFANAGSYLLPGSNETGIPKILQVLRWPS